LSRSYISLENILKSANKALLIGIGGGGDIVGTIPTASLLEMFGVECVYGGLSWERSVLDPVPGPRTYEETLNARKLNDVVWYANPDTTTSTGVRFAESGFSEVLGVDTLLVDINPGPKAVAEGILGAARELGADLIIGVDVGGDVIAKGDEPGLMSPLADSIMVSALTRVEKEIPVVIGLFGFGSDGELTHDELEESIKTIAQDRGLLGSWGITHDALGLLERVIEVVPTEASRHPTLYAKGEFCDTTIRSGRRNVSLSIASTVTFYFSPAVIFEKFSSLSRLVNEARSLQEANAALNSIGVKTELDIEVERLKEGLEND